MGQRFIIGENDMTKWEYVEIEYAANGDARAYVIRDGEVQTMHGKGRQSVLEMLAYLGEEGWELITATTQISMMGNILTLQNQKLWLKRPK
jgi:hypothetical protein